MDGAATTRQQSPRDGGPATSVPTLAVLVELEVLVLLVDGVVGEVHEGALQVALRGPRVLLRAQPDEPICRKERGTP